MKTTLRWRLTFGAGFLSLAAARAFAAGLDAPADSAVVEVSLRNPGGFADMDRSPGQRSDWLGDLRRYVVKRASRSVPAGDRLIVTITDAQRAGQVEPWHRRAFSDVRIVRDSTPPRIDLVFQLVSSQGAVLKEGTRQLRDPNFLGRTTFYSGESLAYEKNLIDDWLRQDFGTPHR